MVVDTVVWVLLVVAIGPYFLVLGLGSLGLGIESARKCYAAVAAAETPIDSLEADDGSPPYAKLTATVEATSDPVETAAGDDAAFYHVQAVRTDFRNVSSERLYYKELLADAVRFETATVRDRNGRRCRLTAEADGHDEQWGDTQRRTTKVGWMLKDTDFLSATWTREETYSDEFDVPDGVREYLETALDVATPFELDHPRVRELRVAEDVVAVGDTIRIVGRVEPRTDAEPPSRAVRELETDGSGGAAVLNLTGGTTVTTDSWRAVAWHELKWALRQLVGGLTFAGGGLAIEVVSLRHAGLL